MLIKSETFVDLNSMKKLLVYVIILVALATGTTPPECNVNNPYIQNIEISDARLQFDEIKEDLQRLAAKLEGQGVVSETGRSVYPSDCNEVSGLSGVYTIQPAGCPASVKAYCDMETDGGGWTVIQRREDSSVGFNRGWTDYRNGFGSKFSEHWLGNENLFWLTAQGQYELRVDLRDFNGSSKYAMYYSFRVGDEANRYQLQVANYDGTAGDALSSHDRTPFTTPDFDNDKAASGNCAAHFGSGWWFTNCYHVNLNGLYRIDGEEADSRGIIWSTWRGLNISLQYTEMKIRPTKFPVS